MAKFQTISKDSSKYSEIERVFNSTNERFDYDGMAEAYNDTEVDGYLAFEFKRGKSSVVANQLQRRGLRRGVDFDVRSKAQDGTEDGAIVMVQRLSDVAAGPAQHGRRGRPAASAGATETASAEPAEA